MPHEKLTYTVREMAQALGIGMNAAYALVHSEGFPAIWTSARRVVIPKERLHAFLNEQASNGGQHHE